MRTASGTVKAMRLLVCLIAALVFVPTALAVTANEWHGSAGTDIYIGNEKNERIWLYGGPDYAEMGPGDDFADGGGDYDQLQGQRGDDELRGDYGFDVLTGGKGSDRMFGGPGGDEIRAFDEEFDVIRCGDGSDIVYADRIDDVAADCEDVMHFSHRKR